MKRPNPRRANALIIVSGILFLVSTIVVTFAKTTTAEMVASSNFAEKIQARLLSQAGTLEAISRLRSDFRTHVFSGPKEFLPHDGETAPPADWCFRTTDVASAGEDNFGDGLSVDQMQVLDLNGDGNIDPRAHPSYAAPGLVNGRKISGTLGDDTRTFTLKILDASSQIDLNSHLAPKDDPPETIFLTTMLENLSRAIADTAIYSDKFGDDNGPFFADDGTSLAPAIIIEREDPDRNGGFVSKSELLQIPGANKEKMELAMDYVTVYSPKRNVVSRNGKFPDDAEPYKGDGRAPINVNTASLPVLIAVFQGITYQDPKDPDRQVPITAGEARDLAEKICEDRVDDPFFSWEQFKNYLLTNQTVFGGTAGEQEEKALIVYANCDPNTSLRRLNPDRPAYQRINKTDLLFNTTELCFYPQGVFEIFSLGEVTATSGSSIASAEQYTVVRAYSLMHKNTQVEFQTAHLVTNPFNKFAAYNEKFALNATSHVNPQRMQPAQQESIHFGYVQPVISDFQYDVDELDTLADIDGDGNNEPPAEGDLLFKCNFNKTVEATAALGQDAVDTTLVEKQLIASPKFQEAELKDPLAPMLKKDPNLMTAPNSSDNSTSFSYGDIAPDGIIFWEDMFDSIDDESSGTAKEQLLASKAKTTLCYQAQGNLPHPPISVAPGPDKKFAESSDGTIAFWFKLNDNDSNRLRTVFFATTVIDKNAGALDEIGIQMEVKMSFDQGSGALEIHAQRKFYTETLPSVPATASPFTLVGSKIVARYDATTGFGIKAHEWYHFAVRWRNDTDLTGTDAILLTGNFYSADPGTGELSDTPTTTGTQGSSLLLDSTSILPRPNPANPLDPLGIGTLKAEDYAPLEPNEVDSSFGLGRMYFGAMFREAENQVESMAMTIDDIRIFKGADAINSVSGLSRYPQMDDPEGTSVEGGIVFGVISKFNGSFTNKPKNPVQLGIMDFTLRTASGTFSSSPFILRDGAGLSRAPVEKPRRAFADELMDEASTPISLWQPQQQKKPLLIDDDEDFDEDATQLGVKNEVWEFLYEKSLNSEAEDAISLQSFIDTFGILIIVVWEIYRGPLPPLSEYIGDDFKISEGDDDDETDKIPISGGDAYKSEMKKFGEDLEDRGKEIEDATSGDEKERGKHIKEGGKKIREGAEKVKSDEVKSGELKKIVEGLFKALFATSKDDDIIKQDIIDYVNDNLLEFGNVDPDFQLNDLNDLDGGVIIVPLPLLGLDIEGDDDDNNDKVDDDEADKVGEEGGAIADATNDEIEVLPKATNFDFQLRFQMEQDPLTGLIPQQFVAPLVDDVTVTFQEVISILEQSDL